MECLLPTLVRRTSTGGIISDAKILHCIIALYYLKKPQDMSALSSSFLVIGSDHNNVGDVV